MNAIRTWMTLALILVAASILPASHAGLLQCQSHTITAMDLAKATSAAKRAAGHSKLANTGRSVCMNPGRGRVWYEAVPEPQTDGSVVHPHLMCIRETGPWTCEKLQDRTANIFVERAGNRYELEFDLPMSLSLDEARELAARAFEIGPSMTNASCREEPDPKDPEFLAKPAFGPTAFDPAAEAYERSIVEQPNGGRGVAVDSDIIIFARGADGAWEVAGCGAWITVT